MKRLTVTILCGIMIFLLSVTAQAENSLDIPMQKSDILCKSSDFEAVKKLESQMLIGLREMYDGVEMPSDFPEKMDFSEAVKIYVDTGIQDFNTDKESEIMENLRQSTYVWVIPMVISGENVRVTVAKGRSLNPENASVLTEAEKEEVRDNEGKWIITEIGVGGVDSYLLQLSKNPNTKNGCDHVVLIGGIPGMRQPAALGFQDGKAKGWLTLGYQYPILEELPKTRSLSYTLYDYETVMEASQKYVYSDDDTAGGGGAYMEKEVPISIFIVAVPAAIIAIAVGLIVIWDKKKYKDKAGQS